MKGSLLVKVLAILGVLMLVILACAPKPAAPPEKPVAPPEVKKEPYIIGVGGYRTGPYQHAGTPTFNACHDVVTLANMKGGIEGWPVEMMELETAYETPRIVEAYERIKAAGNMVTFFPHSTGGTYALTPRVFKDKIPLVHIGHGISAACVGEAFPYNFLIAPSYWHIEGNATKFIADQEGGEAMLKGKKIAIVYIDVDYGRETVPIMKELGKRLGFELLTYPVPPPALEQSGIWSEIAKVSKPDWIIMRHWGMSTVVALKEAKRVGYPMKRIIGCPWSPFDPDIDIAGHELCIGVRGNYFTCSGRDFPIIKEIWEKVYLAGKGRGREAEIGTQPYMRGLVMTQLAIEATRLAVKKFGHPVRGEQVKWGYEQITPEIVEKAGLIGIIPTMTLTPTDHMGYAATKIHEWDGKRLVPITDWISGYTDLCWEEARRAAAIFKEKNPELYK